MIACSVLYYTKALCPWKIDHWGISSPPKFPVLWYTRLREMYLRLQLTCFSSRCSCQSRDSDDREPPHTCCTAGSVWLSLAAQPYTCDRDCRWDCSCCRTLPMPTDFLSVWRKIEERLCGLCFPKIQMERTYYNVCFILVSQRNWNTDCVPKLTLTVT